MSSLITENGIVAIPFDTVTVTFFVLALTADSAVELAVFAVFATWVTDVATSAIEAANLTSSALRSTASWFTEAETLLKLVFKKVYKNRAKAPNTFH